MRFASNIPLQFCICFLLGNADRIYARDVVAVFTVKKNESSNKTIRMPNDLIERLERVSKDKDVSFSQLVIQCCEYALGHAENGES